MLSNEATGYEKTVLLNAGTGGLDSRHDRTGACSGLVIIPILHGLEVRCVRLDASFSSIRGKQRTGSGL